MNFDNNDLSAIIDRIEFAEARIKDEQDARKEVYAEAKGKGYDAKVLRTIVRKRKQDREKLAEEEAVEDTYRAALGM